jgi:hypothetical protein
MNHPRPYHKRQHKTRQEPPAGGEKTSLVFPLSDGRRVKGRELLS